MERRGERNWHAAEPRPLRSGIIIAHVAVATESGEAELW